MENKLSKYKSRKQLLSETNVILRSRTPDMAPIRHLTLIQPKSKTRYKNIDQLLSSLSEPGWNYLITKVKNKIGPAKLILDINTKYSSSLSLAKIKEQLQMALKNSDKSMYLHSYER